MNSYADLIVAYVKWLLFLCMNFMFTSVRNFMWILNGTQLQVYASSKEENYDSCVHVMNAIWKHRLDMFMEASTHDYVLVHDHFEHPDYLLSDDITLLNMTDTHAIFTQSKPNEKPPFRHNFIVMGQYHTVDKILMMPLNQFHKFAETMKRDDGHIAFLQNQSRCGGSLFTSILMDTERCITFNEPHALNSVCRHIYCNKTWEKDEASHVLKNTITVICKPYNSLSKPPLLYVIKPTATSIISADIVSELMPEVTQIFIYRHPVEVAISVRRLGEALKSLRALFYAPNIPNMIAPSFALTGNVDTDFLGWTPKHSAELEFGYRVASLATHHYLRCLKQGVPISAIKYEDLIKHPHDVLRHFFKACKLPDDLVELGLQAMKKDSQEETLFSRKKLKKLIPNPPKPTPQFLEAAREISQEFDIPGPDEWVEDFHLIGSFKP